MSKMIVLLLLILLLLTGCAANQSWDTPVYLDTANITNLISANITAGTIVFNNIKSGANQTAAGAAINEIWIDTSDNNTLKVGK